MKKLSLIFASLLFAIFSLSAVAQPSQSAVNNFIKMASPVQQPNAPNCQIVYYNDANFCPDFVQSAKCFCVKVCMTHNMSQEHCENYICASMKEIYDEMIVFGIPKACAQDPFVPVENCEQDWSCYLNGWNGGKQGAGDKCTITNPAANGGCSGNPGSSV